MPIHTQAENEALQQLVLEVAQDKANAQSKLVQLRERFKSFIKGSGSAVEAEAPASPTPAPQAPASPVPPQAIPRPVPQVTKGEERPAIPFLPFQPPRMAQQPTPVAPPVPPPTEQRPPVEEVDDTKKKQEEKGKSLLASAQMAVREKIAFFITPTAGAAPGTRIRVYYNRIRGPLPHGASPWLKVGYNKWEQIVETKMRYECISRWDDKSSSR